MTRPQKLLTSAGLLLSGVLAALLLLPSLLEDAVTSRVEAELDRALSARVTWGEVGLTFFRDFPDLTLGLRELTVVGEAPFQGDTLASVETLRLVLDLGSVVGALRERGPVVVRSVRLERPELRLRVLEDGRASWDIVASRQGEAQPGGETGEAAGASRTGRAGGTRSLAVDLREVEVLDGRVVLDNRRSEVYAELEGLRHSLSGSFSREGLVATTRTHAERTTLRFAGAPWLAGATLDFDAELGVDPARRRATFRDNTLRLNDLLLRFSGEAGPVEGGLEMDMAFQAPSTELRQLLSLVPVLWRRDFASLETAGTFALEGSVRGTWGEEDFPALALTAQVEDGAFRYPDLPLPAREISAELAVENPGGDPDLTVARLDRLHLEIGDQPLDASVTLRTPVSDPDVDARVQGTLDLGALARTVKLEGAEGLSGSLTADATVRARLSDVDSARWERVEARGTLSAREVTLGSGALRHPLAVETATLELSPRRAELRSFRGRVGSSDLQADGTLDNLLAFWLRGEALRGRGTFTSSRFVLDEWRSEEEELTVIPVPAMLELTLEGTVDTLVYGALEMRHARGGLRVAEQRLTLESFTLETLGGRMGMTGSYETTDPARPTFDFEVTMDSLDVPGASAAFLTVRTLAPVARYARGRFSARLELAGALGPDMTPAFDLLTGEGSLATSRIAIEGFPLLERLGTALGVQRLASPTFDAVRSSVRIADGRLHVEPFRVSVAGIRMTVEGSNGLDRSLDYTLGMTLPRSVMGGTADRLVQDLAARAGRVGLDASAADSVRLGVRVTGTVPDPSLELGLGEAAASVGEAARRAAGAAVEERVEEARERLDSTRAEAQARARARADSMVAAAEARAEEVRAEARRLAEGIRAEADRRVEELLARAGNPVARAAARPVADRIRQEADERAEQVVREADQRADALVAEARRRARELVEGEGGGAGGR